MPMLTSSRARRTGRHLALLGVALVAGLTTACVGPAGPTGVTVGPAGPTGVTVGPAGPTGVTVGPTGPIVAPARSSTLPAPGNLPLLFIENQGQAPAGVTHYLQGSQASVAFTPSGLTLGLTGPDRSLRVGFVGATPTIAQGIDAVDTSVNFLVGDEATWRRNVPVTSSLRYSELWPGIDLVYTGSGEHLKYTFHVRPGADPAHAALAYQGASDVRVTPSGDLEVTAGGASFLDQRPVAWQDVDGVRVPVAVEHRVRPGDEAGTFTASLPVGPYDPAHELVIDPTIVIYAGYLAGPGDDSGVSIAVDGDAAAYFTGDTTSVGLSPPSAIAVSDASYNGLKDAYVAKVRPDGSGFAYVTYVGGTHDDASRGIAVDGDGSAYITGSTASPNFPVSPAGVYDSVQPTTAKAFVFKLKPAGTQRDYATFLKAFGGGRSIAVDGGGRAVVAGATTSMVAKAPAYDTSANGGLDAFVTRLDVNGTGISSTYLGGNAQDIAFGVAIDPTGTIAYVTGSTKSSTFPRVPLQPPPAGLDDVFVARLDLVNATLDYSRLLGGSGNEVGRAIARDTWGNAIVVGETTSPTINNWNVIGGQDGFLAKFDPTGTLVTSSFQLVGGTGLDGLNGVAVDGMGNIYVAGGVASTVLMPPVLPDVNGTGPLSPTNHGGGGDALVIKFPPTLGAPLYGGYFGGPNLDWAAGIAVDWGGFAYVVGSTTSSGLSTNGSTASAMYDAFYVKIGPACTVMGTPGNDAINLHNNLVNVICGLDGDDVISSTGPSIDIVIGGPGNDTIFVGDGTDVVDGGPGDDQIGLGNGDDMAFGSSGNDTINGGEDVDAIDGGTGNDTVVGGSGRNVIRGGGGDDGLTNQPDPQNVTDGGGPAGIDTCTGSTNLIVFCNP